MEKPLKLINAKLSIRKVGSSYSLLISEYLIEYCRINLNEYYKNKLNEYCRIKVNEYCKIKLNVSYIITLSEFYRIKLNGDAELY